MAAQFTADVNTQTAELLAQVDGLDADAKRTIAQYARDIARSTYCRTLDRAQALYEAKLTVISELTVAGA